MFSKGHPSYLGRAEKGRVPQHDSGLPNISGKQADGRIFKAHLFQIQAQIFRVGFAIGGNDECLESIVFPVLQRCYLPVQLPGRFCAILLR